jgi:D-amino peptidase
MRVLVSYDLEGVAGIVDWDQCRPGSAAYSTGCALLAGELTALVEGLRAGGATEILLNDSHGSMHNLDPAQLPLGTVSIAGRQKPLYMMEGVDRGVSGVVFLGYHGAISGRPAVLSHTYNPATITRVTLNGEEVGESGINALAACAEGAPVILLTGDDVAVDQAAWVIPTAERLAVKRSITRFAAESLHPMEARTRIRAAAERAMARLRGAAAPPIELPPIELPAVLDVELATADLVELATWVKGVEKAADRTVRLAGSDLGRLHRSFVALVAMVRAADR